ncbi:MAG: hypothetical protein LBQ47_08030 [Endomicrobium sp.]|nr:hypothetical protein [Endomicrobium sp.]
MSIFKKYGIYDYILNAYGGLRVLSNTTLVKEFDDIISEGGLKQKRAKK